LDSVNGLETDWTDYFRRFDARCSAGVAETIAAVSNVATGNDVDRDLTFGATAIVQ
jgi:hypothetical protein